MYFYGKNKITMNGSIFNIYNFNYKIEKESCKNIHFKGKIEKYIKDDLMYLSTLSCNF